MKLSLAIAISVSAVLCVPGFSQGQEPGPVAAPSTFTIQSAEEKYSQEAAKAESESAKILKTAAAARLKAYKDKLVEVTKAGDFDKAIQIKARIDELEQELPDDTDKPRLPRGVKIYSATYGVNQSLFDVTDKLHAILAKKKDKAQILVTNELFGDPAPGYPIGKTLIIRYQHGNKIQIVAIHEGKPLILP